MSDKQIKEMIYFMLTDLSNHGALNYPFAWIVNSNIELPPKIMSELLKTVKECIKDSESS